MAKSPANLYWVKGTNLAVGPAPQGGNKLMDATIALRKAGIDLVVSAQPLHEAASLGLENQATACAAAKIRFIRVEIPDHNPPSFADDVIDAIDEMALSLLRDEKVFVHCFAGIGRSPSLAAAALVRTGMGPTDAIRALREARGIPVPETTAQVEWVFEYAERF